MTFTPGPWYAANEMSKELTIGPTGYCVAVHNHPSDDNAQADARLIAAAPELLEALEALSALQPKTTPPTHDGLTLMDSIVQARAAIRKARGE